jgi:predicted helicase
LLASLERGDVSARVRELRDAVESALGKPLDDAAFADIAAQTLVNAIFAARVAHLEERRFTATAAFAALPDHDHVLQCVRAMFEPNGWSDERFASAVDEFCEALARTNPGTIAAGANAGDPLLYFYERFLAAYDPALRGLRGVYFTPQPVVRYIVRAAGEVLEDAFGIAPDACGAAVAVLDPACGTGAFLDEFVRAVRTRFIERDEPEAWHSYAREVLLPRLAGFELLLVPFVIAHLKLALTLRGTELDASARARYGLELGRHDCLRIELTNALEPGAGDGREHGVAAGGIALVLGNPPYSGHSANGAAPHAYFAGVREANTKWLHDDYVKFIRFAEERVERAGRGVVAFVTNHAYLDNPTFAGMRRHLVRTFDEIFILDLHGNAKIVETAPGGSRDENVFDIRQGVAIGIFVKRAPERTSACSVKFAELYGARETKYDRLGTASIRSTPWTTVVPDAAFASFRPARARAPLGYARAPSLAAAMPVSSLGVLTKRDALAVAFTPRELLDRLASFADPSRSDEETAAAFGLPLRDNDRWSIADARRIAANAHPANVRAIQYRCGDARWYYDASGIVARRNRRVLDHLEGAERFAFLVGRQGGAATSGPWDAVWATALDSDQNLFRRGGATVFPVLLNAGTDGARAPGWNFSADFIQYVTARAGERDRTTLSRRAAGYIYGLLNAPRFRAEFDAELRREYPRIPIVSGESFRALARIGWRLLGLHLPAGVPPGVDLPRITPDGTLPAIARVAAHDVVATIAFEDVDPAGYGRVVFGAAGGRFERVHRDAWQRTCGGARVLESFLRARTGRALDAGEVQAFAGLAAVFDRERALLAEADEVVAALLDQGPRGGIQR